MIIANNTSNLIKVDGGWGYDLRSVVYRHGGAGNNWALGYQMASSSHQPQSMRSPAAKCTDNSNEFLQTILDGCLRRELEHCDQPVTLCTMHSIAGGTGSGLGAKLTEELADVYGDVCRVNIAIGPYHMGEVVVQHYNTVLSLSAVASASDAVLLFENETAQLLCRQMNGIARPLLTDVNRLIAANLLPVFIPKLTLRHNASDPLHPVVSSSGLLDDILHLCRHPSYRFLDVKHTPQTASDAVQHTYDSYNTLFKTLAAMQMSGSASERLISAIYKQSAHLASNAACVKSAASIVCFHGDGAKDAARDLINQLHPPTCQSPVKSPHLPTHHHPSQQQPPTALPLLQEYVRSHSEILRSQTALAAQQVCVQYSGVGQKVGGYHRSASLLSNSQAVLPLLQRSVAKAESMFRVGAYVHQYTNYGMERDDFVEAFYTLGGVINSYLEL